MMYVKVGQIKTDSLLGRRITELVKNRKPRVIVDLGAATGEGTTTVLAEAVQTAGIDCRVYAIEAQLETYERLKANTASYPCVIPVHGTVLRSMGLTPWPRILADMRKRNCELLNYYSEDELKGWCDYSAQQVRELEQTGRPAQEHFSGEIIDILVLDAGEFFAKQELLTLLDRVDLVILDDVTKSYKNMFNNEFLSSSPDWKRIAYEPEDRNGWSAFIRRRSLRTGERAVEVGGRLQGAGSRATKASATPKVHFVYSGNPLNDASIVAPETIANHVFRFLERRCPVQYYDWADTRTPVDVDPQDVILGHPHFDQNSVLRRLFAREHAAGYLLWPFHSRYPDINRYAMDVAAKADKLFAISGPYWTEHIAATEYAGWKERLVRVDNAIDAEAFPLLKTEFNAEGQRGFFIMSRSGKEKGATELFTQLRTIPGRVVVAGGYAPEDLEILQGRPDTVYLGLINWRDLDVRQYVMQHCDFFLNLSVSDASPTALLESMALGLVPITTPQCGYYYPSLLLLSLEDLEHNRLLIRQAQGFSQEHLMALQAMNRRIIVQNHSWERFLGTIWQKIERRVLI